MNDKKIIQMVKLLKVIANENRLKVLYHIANKELYVGEIEKKVGISQSALSQHLAVMRDKNLVVAKREAQMIFYGIKEEKLKKLLDFLDKLF